MRTLLALVIATAVAACGQQADLKPVAGTDLPPAPFGTERKPDAEELLAQDTLAEPERSVELRRRSEEREDDPFDLPPE
ncbi:hypothetical protein [Parerythrobacter jejuensis]|uniref:Uncharacterized protein n=1 Tax=Parerythrobacter jejuensis TaxID=795812 RepID=A0A845AR73_9SPHN|nr:hypothetical protein [Parerythrobacter jejuensis]MXP31693.1 hypothetical protein [Parerythrobacter jejuensis]